MNVLLTAIFCLQMAALIIFVAVGAVMIIDTIRWRKTKGGGIHPSATPPPIKQNDEEGYQPDDCQWR